ncbi:MAG: hypothetical protein M1818_008366 [Claussenomyces sp. TS43310]|nr:MAG: hypothetical protein M1818_008366 [Claussenomyces sp. TS43310]
MAPKLNYNVNGRTMTAPLAAFCMAAILFVYARTSIQAAKRNAQKHREADGGQISWRNESLRRHGVLEAPAGAAPTTSGAGDGVPGVVRELLGRDADVPGSNKQVDAARPPPRAPEEQRIRDRAARRVDG